jgi:hypothetical protein
MGAAQKHAVADTANSNAKRTRATYHCLWLEAPFGTPNSMKTGAAFALDDRCKTVTAYVANFRPAEQFTQKWEVEAVKC